MSQGKYSPFRAKTPTEGYIYNCRGVIPSEFDGSVPYDTEFHFTDYDSRGYDRYGYSALDADGNFVGHGDGVDSNGMTEMEYLSMNSRDFRDLMDV